jgi:N-acetylmuramoyl-L-alanine amidase
LVALRDLRLLLACGVLVACSMLSGTALAEPIASRQALPFALVPGDVDPTTTGTASPKPTVSRAAAADAPQPAAPDPAAGNKAPVPVVGSGGMIAVDGGTTRFSLELSGAVPIDAFSLGDPYRVIVDVPEMRFDVAASREPKGLIHSWRYGLFATGRSRLVFDTTGPTRIVAAKVEPEGAGRRARLVLELVATDKDAFAAALRQQKSDSTSPWTSSAKPEPESHRPANAKLVVVLDPGHGGLDAGTVSPHTGTPEKQVVLEFSKLLQKKLEQTGRYDVYLTRSTDTFIPLGDRVKFARSHHADVMVSIHADAELDRSVRGSTIFTLSDKASDAQAAALAAKENQSDALAGLTAEPASEDIADILIDLTLRETRAFSNALAKDLVQSLSRTGHMVKQDPHRSASLRVLKAHDIPSVLIELGFLSNKDDEAELVAADWRERTAGSIIASIDRFFSDRQSRIAQ